MEIEEWEGEDLGKEDGRVDGMDVEEVEFDDFRGTLGCAGIVDCHN